MHIPFVCQARHMEVPGRRRESGRAGSLLFLIFCRTSLLFTTTPATWRVLISLKMASLKSGLVVMVEEPDPPTPLPPLVTHPPEGDWVPTEPSWAKYAWRKEGTPDAPVSSLVPDPEPVVPAVKTVPTELWALLCVTRQNVSRFNCCLSVADSKGSHGRVS